MIRSLIMSRHFPSPLIVLWYLSHGELFAFVNRSSLIGLMSKWIKRYPCSLVIISLQLRKKLARLITSNTPHRHAHKQYGNVLDYCKKGQRTLALFTLSLLWNNCVIHTSIKYSFISKSNKPYGPWGQTHYLQIYTMDQTYTWTWVGEGILYVYIIQNKIHVIIYTYNT